MIRIHLWLVATILASLLPTAGADDDAFKNLSPQVLTKEQRAAALGMIDRDIQRRTVVFNAQHRAAWARVTTRERWELYRDERIAHLRKSLGELPLPAKPNVRVTGELRGEKFRIENLLYESRPGCWVAGNLYVPDAPRESMPGILIAHSHHGGKTDGELQDMGMTWARAGCLVLVIDQVGYGERRSHPFHRDSDYAQPFKRSRQDYYFRYDTGIQLQLLGDSLMGWMVGDLLRGVDVLLARDGIDPQRIILLGAVAGGGDPAGVTASLDSRIACCVPFNFGGPQPESKYPLPDDAETSFDFLMGTYWDSTRGLRWTACDDFPHWLITASLAPRHLIHGHEFSWDQERDPAWRRYQIVWGEFYGAADRVGAAHGKGLLKQQPPEASHCNNIGAYHRRLIHPLLDAWFSIKVTPDDEYSARRKSDELRCWTESAQQELAPQSLTDVMSRLGQQRRDQARQQLADLAPQQRRAKLVRKWNILLGPNTPTADVKVQSQSMDDKVAGVKVERVVLEVEPGIVVPQLLLIPGKLSDPPRVMVAVAHAGKVGFLQERAGELAKLVDAGVIVVLPDLRGTGETSAGVSRGRDSPDTDRSTHLQLFGETAIGQRVRDLRSVLQYVRNRFRIGNRDIALWGDSFTPPNSPEMNFQVPHGIAEAPRGPEPLGGLVVLLGGLFEDNLRAIYLAGGLSSYQDILSHFAVLVPHDACVPGALTTGDLSDLAANLEATPLRIESPVDARNRSLMGSEPRTSPAAWLLDR